MSQNLNARTAIRNFVADHLKQRDEKDAALVAFVSPDESQWRFSYVKMEYAAVEKDSGKVGVETRLTPARRFSYLVGESESCHTAQTRSSTSSRIPPPTPCWPISSNRYVAALKKRISQPDDIVLSYLTEAVEAWQGGLNRSPPSSSSVPCGDICTDLAITCRTAGPLRSIPEEHSLVKQQPYDFCLLALDTP